MTAGYCGGDSTAVQNQLKNVQQVQATRGGAFAAILADGSVVTWADAAIAVVTVVHVQEVS